MVIEDKNSAADSVSKNAAKKAAKDAAKAAKKAEHKAAASGGAASAADATDAAAEAVDHSAGKYGDVKMIQSEERHSERRFAENIAELAAEADAAEPVWIRGRVHTSRCKGKQCFVVLRKRSSTVQCVIIVDELRSRQMVKFCGK